MSYSSFSNISENKRFKYNTTAAIDIEQNSQTLPTTVKQQNDNGMYNRTFSGSLTSDQYQLSFLNRTTLPSASSYLSSSVKVSSPLRYSWLNNADLWNDRSFSNSSSKKNSCSTDIRQQYRWPPTIADGSSTMTRLHNLRRKKSSTKPYNLWTIRQQRRTFPPSTDSLRRVEQKGKIKELSSIARKGFNIKLDKKQHQRHSLQDFLAAFYNDKNEEETSSLSPSSNSTSSGQKPRKATKRKGKQPIHKQNHVFLRNTTEITPRLSIHSKRENEDTSSSSKNDTISGVSLASTTPSTPLKFPTPPKRSPIAFFVNHHFYHSHENTLMNDKVRLPRRKSSVVADIIHHVQQRLSSLSNRHHESLTPNASTQTRSILSLPLRPTSFINTAIVAEERQRSRILYRKEVKIHCILFVFGFLFFPLWWVGFGYYLYSSRSSAHVMNNNEGEEAVATIQDVHFDENMTSIRAFAYLNGILSCISLIFLAFILSMIIWMVKTS
ncbi:hypothetical protein BDF20DRAFT_256285 [Mycotypha africana]|uniref:uncharacterized protein n=1 Tax=Mycotypha africana TaxID=64632 RepID=UPI00230150B2|nr:uncharacterized protein BDF20DRAFT_256285 [Mycotypha africana]KAI8987296.1 hypothetical protein BDF20DRAFT_256285 [Mycotypha africana]